MNLDRIDRKILTLLQDDARISNQELADKVGLSPSPCLRRVKQLESIGLIGHYYAQLNAEKLGLDLMALVQVGMDRHTPDRLNNFEVQISQCSEVLECLLITGQSADYQIKVIVKDMQAYQQFLLGVLTQIEGVTEVHSSFVLRRVVDHRRLPFQD